jgi:hypothetical protein
LWGTMLMAFKSSKMSFGTWLFLLPFGVSRLLATRMVPLAKQSLLLIMTLNLWFHLKDRLILSTQMEQTTFRLKRTLVPTWDPKTQTSSGRIRTLTPKSQNYPTRTIVRTLTMQ